MHVFHKMVKIKSKSWIIRILCMTDLAQEDHFPYSLKHSWSHLTVQWFNASLNHVFLTHLIKNVILLHLVSLLHYVWLRHWDVLYTIGFYMLHLFFKQLVHSWLNLHFVLLNTLVYVWPRDAVIYHMHL